MMSGSPPTERNARTGLFTPPTRTCSARAKISAERARFFFVDVWDVLIVGYASRLRFQPFCCVFCMVRQDNIRPGPLDAGQDLKYGALLIEPTFLRCGFHHGVFAADIICTDRDIKTLADASNHIEIRQGGLDHDYVRAFFEIQCNFLEGFAHIRRVHLITSAVAELRCRLRGFAEWPVKRGAIFCGVRKNRHVFEGLRVELLADCRDSPIHHVGGGNDVRPSRACERACSARISSVASFATSPFSIMPQ